MSDQKTRGLTRRLLDCYKSWDALDMEALSPYYSKEPDLLVFNDVEPSKCNGWDEFKQAEQKVMDRVSAWKIVPKDVRVRVWGDVGVTTAIPVLKGESKKGRKYDIGIRHTALWEKKGGRWLISHEHWSFPWPPPSSS